MASDPRSHRGSLRVWTLIVLIVAILAFALAPAWGDDDYKLGSGDTLTILIWGLENDPMSSMQVQVRPDGKISYPVVGELVVSGMSPVQLGDTLAKGLSGLYKDPKVTVMVNKIAASTFSVVGEVYRPDYFEYVHGMGIKDALARSGGLGLEANSSTAKLTHKDGTTTLVDLKSIFAGDTSKEIPIQVGDTLIVEKAVVFVNGEVALPGNIPLKEAENLAALLGRVRGLTDKADTSAAYINRNGKRIPLDIKGLLKEDNQAANIALEPGDIVYFPESRTRVTVVGSVNKAGTFELIPGDKDRLVDALSMAGGTKDDARLNRVKIIRPMPDGTKKQMMINLTKDGPASNIQLVNGDFIEVTRRKRGIDFSQALSAAGSLFWLIRSIFP